MSDSEEAINFFLLFNNLKEKTDGGGNLLEAYSSDSAMRKCCQDLYEAANFLKKSEAASMNAFTAPVNPDLISAMREYQANFEPYIAYATLCSLVSFVGIEPDRTFEPKKQNLSKEWETANSRAGFHGQLLDELLEFAHEQRNDEERWSDDEIDEANIAIEAWNELRINMEIDFAGILRRRRLLPFVMITRTLSSHFDQASLLSIHGQLQDAQRSFVYGNFLASAAMIRAVIETTLVAGYGIKEGHLKSMIHQFRLRTQNEQLAGRLHEARNIANSALHLSNRDKPHGSLTATQVSEREINFLKAFQNVRDLIEQVKQA